ncbi:uncharacterized protein [Phyllobates terribilis]|uniref:uncharacterized protein n=1 Tax=Phyllobates terribilis TaxID=111132 RepID=UPI003CCA7FA6
MAENGFKMMNNQKPIFVSKILQDNQCKYTPTERLLKNPSNIALSEDSVKVEDDIGVNGIVNCANVFKSTEQDEVVKSCIQQRKPNIYKSSVDQCADMMLHSMDYKRNVALQPSGMECQNVTKLPSEVENKRLPNLVGEVGHTFIPRRPERSSIHYRQDGMFNYNKVRNLVSNHCSNTKSVRPNDFLKKEAFFQGIEDICSQDTRVHHGISINNSTKRAILHKKAQHHSDAIDPCKRIKISDVRTTAHKVYQKMFDHQVTCRQMPPESDALAYPDFTSSVKCKTARNGMQKNRFRHSSPDEMKEGLANFKAKDTTEGGSTRRRFLLIDNQGLPYTVVVEEPISIGLSNSTSTSWSNRPLAGLAKSSSPRKVYKCPVCFRIFEYLSYLQRHSIAHSQQKPHVCKVCGKAFKRTSHLTRHKYTHFGGKPCQCQICERRFRDVGELTRHQQTHTGEKNTNMKLAISFPEVNTI